MACLSLRIYPKIAKAPLLKLDPRFLVLSKTCQLRNYSIVSRCQYPLASYNLNDKNFLSKNNHRNGSLLIIPERHISQETYVKYFSPEFGPIGSAQSVLEAVHTSTGLPWWATIALTAVALRTVVTLPLATYSAVIMARVEKLQPELAELTKRLKMEVRKAIKDFGWSNNKARIKYNATMKKLVKELYIRDNCHPFKASLVAWFQMPLWLSVSFALRNMSGKVPFAGVESPVLTPDLMSQGILWFPDLIVPDTTFILPLMLGVLNLTIIELHNLRAMERSRFQRNLTYFMRGVSVCMVPIGASVPSCMCFYWVCSSAYGLTQNLALKLPSVRRALRIPKTPSESTTPYRDMYDIAQKKYFSKFRGSSEQE